MLKIYGIEKIHLQNSKIKVKSVFLDLNVKIEFKNGQKKN
jgi:hypothetical protein